MADVTSIHPADLRAIEGNLNAINNNIRTLNDNVGVVNNNVNNVNQNVKIIYDEIGSLAKDFYEFVQKDKMEKRLSLAHTKVVQIRQELEKKYGHYDIVRRATTGILQADDLGIVKKDTISNATEELMISTPNYWLAPCLVALAAWINDQPELAEKAVREGIKRNDEKTSLFFALICRRAGRQNVALKWTQRYLANQDEERLDRKSIIILDAYASGLLGADSEGVISKQMDIWLEHLSEKSGFVEQQTQQWSDAINLKRPVLTTDKYPYLQKYSKTWANLKDIMEGAMLHTEIFNYFTKIMDQKVSTDSLKMQLDEILNSLVTDFDDEELPLRRQEKFEQFVIDFDGDENRAKKNMALEQSAFDANKDFTQLLTDAAMKPESSHASVSTQKFSIALSKEWILNAYNDVVAQNRMKIPNEIEINVDSFNSKTTDGQNEEEMLLKFNKLIDKEKMETLAQCVLSGFDNFCFYGGIVIGIIGVLMLFGNAFLGMIAIVAGIGLVINYYSKKKKNILNIENIEQQYEQKRKNGEQIIRALLAEVVDFRSEFVQKDSESQKVIDLLEQIRPDQYVKKISGSSRRIKICE